MSINTDYSYYNSIYYTQQTAKKEKLSLMSLIDSNEDKTLSADELSNFVTEFNEKTGGSLDLSSIMAKYDANSDGRLDESEQEAMNKEKALEKLMASGMQNRQAIMMGGQPQSPTAAVDQDGDGSWNGDELTQFINKVIEKNAAKREEEKTITEDAVTKAEDIKLAFQRLLTQGIGTYEKSF